MLQRIGDLPSASPSYESLFRNLDEDQLRDSREALELSRARPLAEYVLKKLPSDLESVAEGEISYETLAAGHDELVTTVRDDLGKDDEETMRLDHLDLMFLIGAYLPLGDKMPETMPESLWHAVTKLRTADPRLTPFMSYEMIIDINCDNFMRTGGMRVFNSGNTGQHERDFYLGHYLAEPYIKAPADILRRILEKPSVSDTELNEALSLAKESLAIFTRYMGAYRRLPRESFAEMRRYLGSYPDGTRNASGAFMPSVQLLELVLTPPSAMYKAFLAETMPYFPTWSQHEIARQIKESSAGKNLLSATLNKEIGLSPINQQILVSVLDHFIQFRMAHLGVTRNKIPEAFPSVSGLSRKEILEQQQENDIFEPSTEDSKGTAGFDIKNILTNGVYRLQLARQAVIANR